MARNSDRARWSRPIALAAAAACLTTAFPHVASGQERREDAARHHDRGVELFREGNHAEAIAEFERAQQLSPSRTNLWNLARCHEQLGQLEESIRYVDQYLTSPELSDERREAAATYRGDMMD
jgi:tetratricopeptide (TPR) repeat protein